MTFTSTRKPRIAFAKHLALWLVGLLLVAALCSASVIAWGKAGAGDELESSGILLILYWAALVPIALGSWFVLVTSVFKRPAWRQSTSVVVGVVAAVIPVLFLLLGVPAPMHPEEHFFMYGSVLFFLGVAAALLVGVLVTSRKSAGA